MNLLSDLIKSKLVYNLEVIFHVNGISMEPILSNNDRVIVKKAIKYEEGNVIVFIYKNERLIVHRIIKIRENCLICKGDNTSSFERININDIIGIVIEKVDKDGVRMKIS